MKKFFKILMVFALLGGATLSCTKDVSQDIVDLQAQDVELQKTITALENTLTATDNALRSDLTATQTDLGTVKTNLESLKKNTETELAALKGRVTATEEDIEKLNGLVSEAQDAIKKLEERATELEKRADAVEGRATELEKRAAELEKAINDEETGLKARVAALEAKVIALAARIQSIVADAPVAKEITTFVFGKKTITNLEMQFTISPASCAKALTTENCEIIVTEGLDVTRAAATADVNKAYKPSIVKVDAATGKVIVDANIQTKTADNAAYWVALRVKGSDKAGEIAKESQFVKAVEGITWNLFDNAKWYTVKTDKKVENQPVGDKEAVVFRNVLFTKLVDVVWQPDQPKKITGKNYMDPDFTDSDVFGDYTIKIGMPDGKDWSLAAVAEKLGIESVAITAPSKQTTIADAKNHQVGVDTPEYKLYTFTEKGKEVGLHMQYAEGSVDSKNRELVGSKAIYAYGAGATAQKEEGIVEDFFLWIIDRIKEIIEPVIRPDVPEVPTRANFAIMIGDQLLPGFGAIYTADLVKNTIHSKATEDELLYEWDYVHFAETTRECFVFEDVVWTSQLDITEVANDWHMHGNSAIYNAEDDKHVDGKADIDKTGIDTFTLELDGIKFTDKTQNLYAAYRQDYRNSSNVTYTTYSTELPFSVEPRHADVAVALTAADFLPVQATGNTFPTTEKVFDLTFADTEAWLGASHTDDEIADIAAAFVPEGATLEAAKINGSATNAANKGDFTLTLDKTKGATVTTAPGKIKYAETYIVEFAAYTKFGVKFTYTVTVKTKAMPFSLEYTPISKNDGNVTLMGQSERLNKSGYRYWFTLEEAHFAKYLEVANADQVPAKEVLTLKLSKPELFAADDKTKAPASLGTVAINGPEAAAFLGQKNASDKEEADTPELRGTFEDVQTLDWKLKDAQQFHGRTVKVTGYLYAGDMKVAEKELIFHTQEPVIKVAATDCTINRVPGEDSIVDLYNYLDIKGVYDNFEAQLLNRTVHGWEWSSSKAAPYYQTEVVIAPVSEWTATLNGDKFVLTSANIKLDSHVVTLVRDNNPGTIIVNIPVQVKSVLDFNDPKIDRVGQKTTIQIVAPLGE